MEKPLALVIEDDKDVAELFSLVLESKGFETEIIRTGRVALALLTVVEPAVVLLDLQLPFKISGIDVLRRIRADRRLTQTRVVVITGHPHLAETLHDEADLVLVKPVDVTQLSNLIERLL